MKNQLLKAKEVAKRLGVKRTRFYEMRPKLIALGLKTVRIGGYTRYLESSLEKVIDKATTQ